MSVVYTFADIQIEIGHNQAVLDHKLREMQEQRWVVLTAENPWGEEFPVFINKQRTGVLRDTLTQSGYVWQEGIGQAEGLPPEVVFLILGIELEDAAGLAYEMSQSDIVTGVVGGFAEVVSLHSNE